MEVLQVGDDGLDKRKTLFTPDGRYRFDLGSMGALGSGAHGVVRAATHVQTGETVAVKVMKASSTEVFAKELAAHGRLRHPHIVELKSTMVDLDRNRVYMVMELCRGGELFDRIAECGAIDESACQRYLFQTASALAHCHKHNVFHRDLKPENVLLDEYDNVKVCDFGLAALMGHVNEDATYLRFTKCGSLMYAAPEVIQSSADSGYAAAKADVWSLGVILYAMLSGALPFQVAHPAKCRHFAEVVKTGMAPKCQACGFSTEATEVVCGMLEVNPDKRYSMDQVVSSAWLNAERAVAQQVGATAPCRADTADLCGTRTPPADPFRSLTAADSSANACQRPPAQTLAAASPSSPTPAATGVRKWSVMLGDHDRVEQKSGGTEVAPAEKRQRVPEAPVPGPLAGPSDATATTGLRIDTEPVDVDDLTPLTPSLGINGMLVRSLGWVQLPIHKEKMVDDVTQALTRLGASFTIEKGELSDVVQATIDQPDAAAESSSLGGSCVQGRLTVRMRIAAGSDDASDLHIERESGNVLQFHSFYRDVRNQLSGTNGWSQQFGRYHCFVPS